MKRFGERVRGTMDMETSTFILAMRVAFGRKKIYPFIRLFNLGVGFLSTNSAQGAGMSVMAAPDGTDGA